jgi:uncharacterized repeat protein (TIGR03803 family)
LAAQLTTILSFNGSNGGDPLAGLIADANGNLFGTTEAGGAWGDGTVFEIQNTGSLGAPVYASTPTTLVNFDGSNGQAPIAAVFLDGNGDLFGTTEMGGVNNAGTVFEIQNTGTLAAPVYASTLTTQINFYGSGNSEPNGALIADANGNLFGTTFASVFEIRNTGPLAAPVYASAPITVLNGNGFNEASASGPEGITGVIADANGDLFGTTWQVSSGHPYSTVFKLQNTGSVTAPAYDSATIKLVGFNDSNGYVHPEGLIADANGDLFGTTQLGGAWGDGFVFEIKNTGTLAAPIYDTGMRTLVSFNGSPGSTVAGLIIDAHGDLFGTTEMGGVNNAGTVFEIQNTGTLAAPVYAGTLTTLVSFADSNGYHPNAVLIADANGNLFGTTQGSLSGQGTVFEITDAGFVAQVSPTIAGTIGGQTTTNEAPVTPFYGVTIGDANAGATDTLTITIGGGGGTLADGVGFNGLNAGAGVYTLSGTASAITSELDALVFTPQAGTLGSSTISTFTLSDVSSAGGAAVVDSTTTVIDRDLAPPTIAGTFGGQTTTMEAPVTPFKGVTIGDANAGTTDIVMITFAGGGTLADGAGFSGLTNAGGAVYWLSGTAPAVTSELDALVFTPKAGAPNATSTTTFTLSDLSSAGGAPAVDSTTTVIDHNPAVPPTIAGAVYGQTTTREVPVTPFKGVTIGDQNAGATDTLTITLGGTGGMLSGAGLSGGTGGVYMLSGTAAAITGELDALNFTPKAGAPNTFSTTTFTLSDLSSAGVAAVNSTTTVIDKTATTIIETRPHALVDAKHHPLGQPALSNGQNVIFSMGHDDIIKPPGANNTEVGGAPGDVLYGGAGDNFVFQTLKASPASHPDIIMNFSERHWDQIDLHDLRTFVPGHEPLVFIGGQSFANYHHHHPTVFGMVRDSQGLEQVNVDRHLTTEMEIVVHGPPTLHAFDFIL